MEDSSTRAVAAYAGGWIKEHTGAFVLAVIAGMAAWFVVNAVLTFRTLGGLGAFGPRTSTSGPFWVFFPGVLAGILGVILRVGSKAFFSHLSQIPSRIGATIKQDGPRAASHLLWGVAIVLILGPVSNLATGVMIGILLLLATGTPFGQFIAERVSEASGVIHLASGKRIPQADTSASSVALIGAALGYFVAYVFAGPNIQSISGIAIAGIAIVLGRATAPSAAAIFWLATSGLTAAYLFQADPASAQGFQESSRFCDDPIPLIGCIDFSVMSPWLESWSYWCEALLAGGSTGFGLALGSTAPDLRVRPRASDRFAKPQFEAHDELRLRGSPLDDIPRPLRKQPIGDRSSVDPTALSTTDPYLDLVYEPLSSPAERKPGKRKPAKKKAKRKSAKKKAARKKSPRKRP